LPDADYLYACDLVWWDVHLKDVKRTFKGELYTKYRDDTEKAKADERGLTALKGSSNAGLGRSLLHFNSNSGAQAINLAYLLGATRIILLGYDMQNTGGKAHWFGDHPPELHNGTYHSYVPNFSRLANDLEQEGIEVINCSRHTALTQFNRGNIEDYT